MNLTELETAALIRMRERIAYIFAENAAFEIHNYPKAALAREDVQTAVAEGWCKVK